MNVDDYSLPEELKIKILSYLDTPDLDRTSLVCKQWNRLVHDEPLWRDICKSIGLSTEKCANLSPIKIYRLHVRSLMDYFRKTSPLPRSLQALLKSPPALTQVIQMQRWVPLWNSLRIWRSLSKLIGVPNPNYDHLRSVEDAKNYISSFEHWSVIYANTLSRVDMLYLENFQLLELPPQIQRFQSLKILNLCDNKLKELPVEIGALQNLKILWAQNNQIKILPDTLSNLTKLKTVDLSSNRLTSLPSSLAKLKAMKVLNLSHNQLSMLPDTYCQWKHLEELNLSHNQFQTLPRWLGTCGKIDALILGNNPFLKDKKFMEELSKRLSDYIKIRFFNTLSFRHKPFV